MKVYYWDLIIYFLVLIVILIVIVIVILTVIVKVYPAYWQQEPQALTLAKKQYQFIQEGFDEDTAYNKARAYVDELEDKSYQELKSFLDTFKDNNINLPYLSDKSIADELTMWKQKLLETPYEELDLADQGSFNYNNNNNNNK